MSTKQMQLLTLLCAAGIALLNEGFFAGGIGAIVGAAVLAHAVLEGNNR
jgi:hypothetical protein